MSTTIRIPAPLEAIAEHVEEFVARLRGHGHEAIVSEGLVKPLDSAPPVKLSPEAPGS